MTDNAQAGKPFGGTARSQTWVMRSLSPWIRRMASGPASRASITSSLPIGEQAAQHADWISRRADRIQRAAAWNGELGAVSPALIDRFAQRVANRVQRSPRAHQVDAYAGGDNIDRQLDMPLVTNEGDLTPVSDGNTSETPFTFGAFSPENVQRKPAPLQAEAPAAPPTLSNALRERAEQLRRSLATNTPAPAIQPAHSAPSIQPSRAPATPGVTQAAPRAGVMRARPTTRIEELGPGKAPAPAPATPPVPEPPKPAQTQVQRAPQPAMPNVQRTALPPQVVQGQGRLTQMLNARFKPKLDEARNPDAPHANVDGDAGDAFTGDETPRILRSAVPPAARNTPNARDDLTPRTPVQRAPAEDMDSSADVPIPTPKPRLLRKPALPATKPPPATTSSTAPAVQRKADAPPSITPADVKRDAPATLSPKATPPSTDAPVTASSTNAVPAVQRMVEPLAQSPENILTGAPRSEPTNAPPAIQREVEMDAAHAADLPLASPAPHTESSIEPAAISAAPFVQRDAQSADMLTSDAEGANIRRGDPVWSPASHTTEQSSHTGMEGSHTELEGSHTGMEGSYTGQEGSHTGLPLQANTPVDLTLHTPQSAPADTMQRSAVTETSTSVTGDDDVVQRDATQAIVSEAAPAKSESRMPLTEAPEAVQRITVNAPPADALNDNSADVDQGMPLVQRAPTGDTGEDAPVEVTPAQPFSSTPTAPAIQREAAPAKSDTPPGEVHRNADAPPRERSVGVIQRASTLPTSDEALTLQTPAAREADAPTPEPSLPADEPAQQTTTMKTAPAVQREPNRSEATQVQRSATAEVTQPAIQHSSAAEMVLRSPARDQQTSAVMDESSSVIRHSSAAKAIAVSEPAVVVRRKTEAKTTSRMAGVAMADMPVLRTAAGAATDGVMQPEARSLAMPIVQRATVKHEQQAMQMAQARPVNPYVIAQEKANAMPVVQRAPASDAPDVQRAVVEEPVAEAVAKSVPQAPARDRAMSDAELTKAAQRLLPIIKRMMMLERERLFGR